MQVIFIEEILNPRFKIQLNYIFSICQSIGSIPSAFKYSLVLEKGLLPKNPRDAESGLGCTDFII